jgi:hypothetical protein
MKNKFLYCAVFFCAYLATTQLRAQNYDSLFAERERILLAGVDYQRGMIKWDFARAFNNIFDVQGEKKINLNFSWTAQFIYNYNSDQGGVQGNVGLRYYYNLEERIIKRWTRKQKKTSCFSADYFEADYGVGWNYGPWNTDAFDNDPLPPGIITGPTLKMGTQRSLNKYFFYDLNVGYNVIINYKGRAVATFAIGVRI